MNESGREISELAELLPVPAGRDLPTARKQILREHLMTEISQPGRAGGQPAPHRGPRRPVLVTGAILAAAAVAATVVVTNAAHTKQAARAPYASVTTAELLAKIANAAARQPSPAVRDSDFAYIRSEVAYTTYTVGSD